MSESAAQEPRDRGLSLQFSIATSFVALLVFICASIDLVHLRPQLAHNA